MTARRRAVFLDRDGVVTEAIIRGGKDHAPLSLEEFQVAVGAGQEVARLHARGLPCIVVTNQPEIARGLLDPAILEDMNARLREETGVDGIYVCPHDPNEGCNCHKPKPGLLLAAAREHSVDLPRSFLVGDRWRDIGAGRAVGCYTILLERPYSACSSAEARVGRLAEAVDLILARLESGA